MWHFARSSETMMTIKTMIINKEMLTIPGSSETAMTTISNYEMPIVTIVSSSMAFAYMKTMISCKEMMMFSIRITFLFCCVWYCIQIVYQNLHVRP